MKPQIKYTKTGEEEITLYLREQQDLLEKYLLQEKYVIGDGIIEITGSDIDRIKQKIVISYKKPRGVQSMKLASYLYGTFGAILVIFGFLYPYIDELLVRNTQQAIIIITGLLLSFVGIFIGIYVKIREKRLKETDYRKETLHKIAEA